MREYDKYLGEHHHMVRMLKAKNKDLWRIHFEDSGAVEMLFIGLHNTESGVTKLGSADDLPEWAQHRIAALNVFGEGYPTDYVDGVGRRITKRTYYVEE